MDQRNIQISFSNIPPEAIAVISGILAVFVSFMPLITVADSYFWLSRSMMAAAPAIAALYVVVHVAVALTFTLRPLKPYASISSVMSIFVALAVAAFMSTFAFEPGVQRASPAWGSAVFIACLVLNVLAMRKVKQLA